MHGVEAFANEDVDEGGDEALLRGLHVVLEAPVAEVMTKHH